MIGRLALSAPCLAVAATALAQDAVIRVLPPTWLGFAPALLAQDLGCYAQQGVTLDFRFEDDRANVMAAMERGDIDADMRTVGEHQGRPRAPETPGIITGTIDISVGGDGVLVNGLISMVADLAGKRVAIEPNIPARLLLQMEFAKAGLSINDVDLREITTADSIAVFADPSIAAVDACEPFLSQAVSILTDRAPRMLVSSRDAPDLIVDVLTARDAAPAENPARFESLLRCVHRAADFQRASPDDFSRLAAPYYGLSAEEVSEIIETSMAYTTYEDDATYLGEGGGTGTLHPVFDAVMKLDIDSGAADTVLSAKDEIDNGLLTGLFVGHAR
ncbi:ABC transporter substrate-binding protein [Rubrimonas cliftonensis]|uniref:NitT/TauT family transport system substrate-binding protein n=1 Tax=Rubrimonas cliftonensis TaxID=89524 RepID=A0A1H3VIY9_9RHOB|nr:ABC transporter substrate-binding protein [Rubrimonas cliftonensis]SDZ74757.1 NitT/TauT family transport system substrate-binding protein [Rubrimonas cliftonensis]